MTGKDENSPAASKTEQSPGEIPVDPANTGPATSHPEAEPVSGFNPEHATEDRAERDKQAGKR